MTTEHAAVVIIGTLCILAVIAAILNWCQSNDTKFDDDDDDYTNYFH